MLDGDGSDDSLPAVVLRAQVEEADPWGVLVVLRVVAPLVVVVPFCSGCFFVFGGGGGSGGNGGSERQLTSV